MYVEDLRHCHSRSRHVGGTVPVAKYSVLFYKSTGQSVEQLSIAELSAPNLFINICIFSLLLHSEKKVLNSSIAS